MKVKVRIPVHTMKVYEGEEVHLHSFLTRVLDRDFSFIPWPMCPRCKDPLMPSE